VLLVCIEVYYGLLPIRLVHQRDGGREGDPLRCSANPYRSSALREKGFSPPEKGTAQTQMQAEKSSKV